MQEEMLSKVTLIRYKYAQAHINFVSYVVLPIFNRKYTQVIQHPTHVKENIVCVGNPIFHSHNRCAITIIHCVKPVNSQSNSATNELYLGHIWSQSQSCLRLRKAPKSKFIRKSLDSIQSCQHIITTSVIQSVTYTQQGVFNTLHSEFHWYHFPNPTWSYSCLYHQLVCWVYMKQQQG